MICNEIFCQTHLKIDQSLIQKMIEMFKTYQNIRTPVKFIRNELHKRCYTGKREIWYDEIADKIILK